MWTPAAVSASLCSRRTVRCDAGFTLVELLVSLALLAMAAVLVGQGLSSDRNALRRLEAHTTAGETVETAQDLIRDRIEALFARSQFDSAGAHVQMVGAPDALIFLSPRAEAGGVAQIGRFWLGVSGSGDLVLQPQTLVGEAQPSGDASVLLRNVRALDFAYYGPEGADRHPAWRSAWSHERAPPELVRMRVGFAEGDRRWWPELIVRPAATVDSACMLDRETALCRGRQ